MIHLENISALAIPALFQLNQSQIDGVLANIMKAARDKWQQEAAQLMTTRRAYVMGIQKPVVNNGYGYVQLVGMLPHLVEEDQPLMRMHQTLLGPNVPVVPVGQRGAHMSKAGNKYRSIPFRHQTPGTIGQGGGVPMGHAYKGHDVVKSVRKLAHQVYGAAKALSGSTSMPDNNGVQWGGRLPAGLAPILRPKSDVVVDEHGNEVARAPHTTDIYAGMVRMEETYELTTQSHYMTFRTISEAQPSKWIRPPTQGRYYAKKVHEYIQRLAPAAFEAFVEGLS